MILREKIKKSYLIVFIVILLFKLLLMVAPGDYPDLALFAKWGNFSTTHSPLEIYQKTEYNLPPLWIFISWLLAKINFALTHQPLTAISEILKIPAVLADIGIGLVIFIFLIKKGLKEKLALTATLFFLLNPFVIFNSSIWGQYDSLYTFFALLSFILLDRRRLFLASFFLALSFLTKLQGIIFLPLFLFLLLNKYSWKKITLAMVIFLATVFVHLLPFLLAGNSLIFLAQKTWWLSSLLRPYLSNNAFNLWWPLQFLASPKEITYLPENLSFLGPLTFKIVGLILFSCFYLLLWLKRKTNIFLLAALVALTFFMIPTAMHERYIFPFFVFFSLAWAMAWPKNKKYLTIYLLLSLTALLNLSFAFATHNMIAWLSFFWTISIFIALLNIFIFFYLFFVILQEPYEKDTNCPANL